MQRNDIVRLAVEGLGADAEGVGKHNGRVVFVPDALPGEEIDALIVKPMKDYAFGKRLKLHNRSADRAEPPCPVYGSCGGCACQHMTYEASLRFKQGQVESCLNRIGGIALPVPLPLGQQPPWRYRNKTTMPVAEQNGEAVAGFYARRSHRVVPTRDCLLSDMASNRVVQTVLTWMHDRAIPAYDETTQSGLVRHVMARCNHREEVMAVLIAASANVPSLDHLVLALRQQVRGLVSVCLCVQDRPDNVILGDTYRTLWGEALLEQRIGGFSFLLSPLSFFQVNTQQAEVLYRQAIELAAPGENDLVADLYSGAGTITLQLARLARHVYGIELSPDATRDARENASKNCVNNVTFLCERAETALPRLVSEGFRPDIVVLDPPRKGAEREVLSAIAAASPRRVVYVSCNPATQARDAKTLASLGYRAAACQPVDLFCQTADVENILLFERGDAMP